MKIYLAASYDRRLEIQVYATILREDGHEITSRWLTGEGEQHTEQWCADQDVIDLWGANCQINFTEGKPSRGGRQVEFGLGIAYGHRLILVGPREHVFHHLENVEQYDVFDSARRVLQCELDMNDVKGGDAA